jgi:hypothetical protein
MTWQQPSPAGDLFRNLADAAGRLIRQELRQGQEEMKGKARASVPAIALLAGAGVCGAAATGTATVLVLRSFQRFLPPTTAAACATTVLGGAAAALAAAGLRELRRVNPVPERTLRNLRADVEAVARPTEAPRTIDQPPSSG